MHIQKNVPLAPYTTFRIGGLAAYYTEVSGAIELAEAYEYAEKQGLPIYVLGGGSNVLFSDAGFSGLVVRMIDGGLQVMGQKISVGAGVPLFDVVRAAAQAGLQGMEMLAGVPGSFGGAVRGNAGAFGTEVGDVVVSVKALDRHSGMVREYNREECAFDYRSTFFKKNPDMIILSAEVSLSPGESRELERTMVEIVAKREEKHPQDVKCAGSFFMNPVVQNEKLKQEFEKDTGAPSKDGKLPAGWLIDHVGLRGKRIGGAMISQKHPNYLLNTGNASAEDIITLASLVKTRVRDELGVRLQEEVQFVGF